MISRLLFVLAGVVAQAAPGGAILSVPFLPQTEALCGGAAAAMVYRYWGDRHADVQQFAPLVDRRAGGIRDSVLVAAIRDKGWRVTPSVGSIATLQQSLAARQPAIVLLEDRPNRYHFIVAVGIDDDAVVVHDPTWGPYRRIPIAGFVDAWTPAHFWMLVVLPSDTQPAPTPAAVSESARADAAPMNECDRRLDAALDEIETRGLASADAALGSVRAACPASAGPLRELAGVRAAQSRWSDAVALSQEAVRLDPGDRYAWDVLGSGLFVQGRTTKALAAWNKAGTPQLDALDLRGVTRTRHALVARFTGLTPNALLTPRAYGLAERRLEELPDRVSSNVSLVPGNDGFAAVTANLRETARTPQGIEWVATGLQAVINREVTASVAGWSGQGEMWSGSWRWWTHRPRVAGSFSAPRTGRLAGVWRVEAAWEAQTYDFGGALGWRREDRRTGLLSIRNWITGDTRYELRGGLDVWDQRRRAVVTGGTLEQRLLANRVALTGSLDRWSVIGGDPHFFSGSATAAFRSSRKTHGLVVAAIARVDAASQAAPLALWSGAGEGRGRSGLIRAHRLLYDGVIDGAIFGRKSGVTNLELQQWFTAGVTSVAVAGFADIAAAGPRLPEAPGRAWQADAGLGFRARVPGQPGMLRIDYAYGLVDGRQRISAGWNVFN